MKVCPGPLSNKQIVIPWHPVILNLYSLLISIPAGRESFTVIDYVAHSLVFQSLKIANNFLFSLRKKNNNLASKTMSDGFAESFYYLQSWRMTWMTQSSSEVLLWCNMWRFASLLSSSLFTRRQQPLAKTFSLKGTWGFQGKIAVCSNLGSILRASDVINRTGALPRSR